MALLAITAGFGAPAFAAPSYFLYVVNIDQANPANNAAISQFNIGTNGTLTALSPATVNVGGAPGGLYADPNGRFLYLAQPGPAQPGPKAVLQFTINNDGTLGSATAATSNNPDAPYNVVIDPSHQYAYVENESVQSIFQYSVGANGAFTALNPAEGQHSPLVKLNPESQAKPHLPLAHVGCSIVLGVVDPVILMWTPRLKKRSARGSSFTRSIRLAWATMATVSGV